MAVMVKKPDPAIRRIAEMVTVLLLKIPVHDKKTRSWAHMSGLLKEFRPTIDEVNVCLDELVQRKEFTRQGKSDQSIFLRNNKWGFQPRTRGYQTHITALTYDEERVNKLNRRYGKGVCTRCGGDVIGKNRHGKSRRGHDQDTCNEKLVAVIMSS